MDALPDFSLREHSTQRRGWPRGPRKAWVGALALAALLSVAVVGCSADTTATGATLANGNAAPTVAVPPSAVDLQQTVINVINTVQPSVVQVQSSGGGGGSAIGSGEIISTDGYIVTNDHVVRGFNKFTVQLSNSKKYDATLKGEAPDNDL
ncbi:MAG TPA: hypothetical protein VFY89_03715, partial [Ktedonobacterales bacterium]